MDSFSLEGLNKDSLGVCLLYVIANCCCFYCRYVCQIGIRQTDANTDDNSLTCQCYDSLILLKGVEKIRKIGQNKQKKNIQSFFVRSFVTKRGAPEIFEV